jgi:sigma-54 dependent transcriptional regulator, gfr operon transcriptional activator
VKLLTNKQSIYETLKKLTKESMENGKKDITANDIAIALNLRRNVVSHYLNELFSEGKALKVNLRPVYFLDKEIYEKNKSKIILNNKEEFDKKLDKHEENVFFKLIGCRGSLKSQVEQCKVAASYPPNGLPILLIGKSGVGKSFIAQLIYEFAAQNNYINTEAPYAIFNCAEYANNPELLSANLFGYQKGTFTGAVSDKTGLIEEADGGYLFLDEVHRLSPEGQEKLFLFLDKGIFRRFGESGKWRKANVRFIFATTEEPEKLLLETFLRRIPLIVKIPSLSERPISEKIQMIYSFYKQEALSLDKDINISSQVINVLLSINIAGNIGKLMNIIKYSCAHAYNLNDKNISLLNINLSNLPKYTLLDTQALKSKYNVKNMLVNRSNDDFLVKDSSLLNESSEINKIIMNLSNSIINHENNRINSSEFENLSVININKLSDELIFKVILILLWSKLLPV